MNDDDRTIHAPTREELNNIAEDYKSFYAEHKDAIGLLLVCVGVYFIQKRMVRKVTQKVIKSELASLAFELVYLPDEVNPTIIDAVKNGTLTLVQPK